MLSHRMTGGVQGEFTMIPKDDDAPDLIYVDVDDDEEKDAEERRPTRKDRRRRVFQFRCERVRCMN